MMRRIGSISLVAALTSGLLLAADGPKNNPKISLAAGDIFPISIESGTTKCAGGQPTGLPFPAAPCTPETKHIITRGETQVWVPAPGSLSGPAASLFDGPITFTVNCTLNASYRGPCWGTVEWDVPALAGTWVGSWNGSFDLITFETSISGVGHGTGGQLDGLQMKLDGGSAAFSEFISFTALVR